MGVPCELIQKKKKNILKLARELGAPSYIERKYVRTTDM